jgi:hypothetical protein
MPPYFRKIEPTAIEAYFGATTEIRYCTKGSRDD